MKNIFYEILLHAKLSSVENIIFLYNYVPTRSYECRCKYLFELIKSFVFHFLLKILKTIVIIYLNMYNMAMIGYLTIEDIDVDVLPLWSKAIILTIGTSTD